MTSYTGILLDFICVNRPRLSRDSLERVVYLLLSACILEGLRLSYRTIFACPSNCDWPASVKWVESSLLIGCLLLAVCYDLRPEFLQEYRRCFSLCSGKHLTPEDVPNKTLSLREATKVAPGGGQGLFHCDCKKSGKQCTNRRCKCMKNNRICTSRCHNGTEFTCRNKSEWYYFRLV